MTDAVETLADAAGYAPRHSIAPDEFAERVAETRENYAKFKSRFEYSGAAEAYRNMLFDTLVRRIVILSRSQFGCAGEIQAGERGPYLKISEAGLIDPHCGSDVAGFWSKNFSNKAEILHLDNPLRLDLKVPRIVIANDPPVPEAGSYLGIPALSGGRFVGYMIVAGAPGGYTPESVQTIKPVVDIYAGVIEYLRADAARAASEEMQSPAVEEAPVIVFNCDNDAGRSINYILGDAEAITGQCASCFSAGGARGYASLIEDACREKVADVIARRVKDGKQYEVEYNILRADGSKRRIYERGFAKYDHELNPVSVDGCALDITELQEAEDGTLQCRKRFQALIEAQTRNYLSHGERAQQAVRAKSEFVSNISHELRTPMHAILSYSKMGMADSGQESPGTLEDYFHKIHSAGGRLLSLINNLLDIARMEAGKMELNKTLYDFSEAIEDAHIEAKPLLENKSLQLAVEIAATDTRVLFDKRRITQVVVNLISNAAKFSPSGNTIRIRLDDGHLPDGGEALCCSVSDNGTGIPENELEAVFGTFVQSSKTKTNAGGTGLGLAICREIVEAHGGKIWAENQKPNGCTLSFTIPKKAAPQAG